MPISIFLAKFLGVLFSILGISLTVNASHYQGLASQIVNNQPARFIIGFLRTLLGLFLISQHNIWVLGWPLLITILVWLLFFRGAFELLFPNYTPEWAKTVSVRFFRIMGVIVLVVACYMLYFGFIHH